jgi:hypothetical protein
MNPKLRLVTASTDGRLIERHGGLLPCRPMGMHRWPLALIANVA